MGDRLIRRPRAVAAAGGLALLAALMTGTPPAAAQFVYPSEGQSPEQQAADEAACRSWAQGQTGVNPGEPPPQVRRGGGGEVLGGAATGAALGAIGGAIGGGAGRGAKIGAGVGAGAGLFNKMRTNREYEQLQAQSQAAWRARQQSFQRAFGACMSGRGYTVQ